LGRGRRKEGERKKILKLSVEKWHHRTCEVRKKPMQQGLNKRRAGGPLGGSDGWQGIKTEGPILKTRGEKEEKETQDEPRAGGKGTNEAQQANICKG